jgi:hypothetical protein
MAFFNTRRTFRQWWIGLSKTNQCCVIFQHGDLCSLLTVSDGIGAHSSGGTFSSLIEWNGNKRTIEKYLHLSGASWFLPFFEKGIREESFTETEVLQEFRRHHGFDAPPVHAGEYPLEAFKNS